MKAECNGQTLNAGACPYCGQLVALEVEAETEEEATRLAAETCSCVGARRERETVQRIETAHDRINQLFGENATEYGFKPLSATEPIELMKDIAVLVARGVITSSVMGISGQCRAKISLTSKGEIKVERSEARSLQLST